MTQSKKKISKSQEIRYQYTQQLIEAGELDTGASYAVTYPQFITEVWPKREQTRFRLSVTGNCVTDGGTVVSPVLHSLAYRKAWKKIVDKYNNRSYFMNNDDHNNNSRYNKQ